ncbi:Cof subfamily protein (haloacid dehalogenase superfamily) [Lactobacillus colini]|uniref:Cof subfamily protein (Haloacid dehalogenase superfamily) n=1 Tax=Lactobacillus colini TaxID=1819254 RepID=A0ABS4MCJ1_9LACO|nr:Cof-type HAD-IIB family hydrolase [Lactobacillus colini]MBP2057402.1 Cof subfamily protein (haloacid dehalogenase superfamily) [Lactobacillus colini]
MTVPFKAVAVDMDGTFLDNNKEYDHELFANLLDKMDALGIKFFVASGNQYAKLAKEFSDYKDKLNFVAENGSYLVSDGKLIGTDAPDQTAIKTFIKYVNQNYPKMTFIVSGVNQAYTLSSYAAKFKDVSQGPDYYYPRLCKLDSFDEIPEDDLILKLAFNCDGKMANEILGPFNKKYGNKFYVTDSGNFASDVMKIGVSKASGLKSIFAKMNLNPKDSIAFGDGGNDITMLKLVGISYAMENAPAEVKAVADKIAPSNDEQGVLKVLSEYLA